jgi:acetyl-CoA synthetase
VPDGQAGELVLRFPWAGTLHALEGSGAEDARRHWHRPGSYATGDRARRRGSDSLEFLGRIDSVVSISGQLVSLSEVRDVLRAHPFVRDAEVVERTDARLGRSLAAAVVLEEQITGDAALARDLLDAVREVIGGLARPRALAFLDRFGPELAGRDRRSALAALLAGAGEEPLVLSWDQIRSSAAP